MTELAKKARSVIRDIDPLNDLTFFRIRSKRQEIMVAPDKNLFLIVIQDQVEEQDWSISDDYMTERKVKMDIIVLSYWLIWAEQVRITR